MQGFVIYGLIVFLAVAGWICPAPAAEDTQESPHYDIQLFGDLYIAEPQSGIAAFREENIKTLLTDARPILQRSAWNIVNFEGTLAGDAFPTSTPKTYVLKMPDFVPDLMQAAGINLVSLANNHSMDFGYPGLFRTKHMISAAGIEMIGAGETSNHASRPLILNSRGHRICIIGFSRTFPEEFWATNQRPGTWFGPISELLATVRGCRAISALTIVYPHWGRELERNPTDYQVEIARQLIDAGADIVAGHHPHVLQEIEIYKERPVFYSLGNFVFTSITGTGPGGAVAAVSILHKGFQVDLTPLTSGGGSGNFKVRSTLLPPSRSFATLQDSKSCQWDKKKRHLRCLFPRDM